MVVDIRVRRGSTAGGPGYTSGRVAATRHAWAAAGYRVDERRPKPPWPDRCSAGSRGVQSDPLRSTTTRLLEMRCGVRIRCPSKCQAGRARWQPRSGRSELDADERNDLRSTQFAFPDERKEPLTDASHVRNAISRFNQVEDVSDAERDRVKKIMAAAERFDVEVEAPGLARSRRSQTARPQSRGKLRVQLLRRPEPRARVRRPALEHSQ